MEQIKTCCICHENRNFSNYTLVNNKPRGRCKPCQKVRYNLKRYGNLINKTCKVCNNPITRGNTLDLCKKHLYHHPKVKQRINEASKRMSPIRWRNRTPEKILEDRQKNKIATIKYQTLRKERLRLLNKEWTKKHPEKCKEIQAKSRKKRKQNITYRIGIRISSSMHRSVRNKRNGSHWENFVNYTAEDLRNHLEKQFKDGMNWDAFMRSEIHIDHIIPHSYFHYTSTNDIEFKKCWALENLQPLWAKDNLEKKNKLPENFKEKLEELEKKVA